MSSFRTILFFGNDEIDGGDGVADFIKIHTNLRKIIIRNVVAPKILSFLKPCVHLRTLTLNNLNWLTDEIFNSIVNKLEHLRITDCKLITIIPWMPNIRTVDLTGCTNIRDISNLANCVYLKRVTLVGCRITNLRVLRDNSNIESVVVADGVDLIKMGCWH